LGGDLHRSQSIGSALLDPIIQDINLDEAVALLRKASAIRLDVILTGRSHSMTSTTRYSIEKTDQPVHLEDGCIDTGVAWAATCILPFRVINQRH